jgi:hypothetical protein
VFFLLALAPLGVLDLLPRGCLLGGLRFGCLACGCGGREPLGTALLLPRLHFVDLVGDLHAPINELRRATSDAASRPDKTEGNELPPTFVVIDNGC